MSYTGKTERLELPKFEYLAPADYEWVVEQFRGWLPDDAQVIIAEYETPSYEGYAFVLYYSEGKLWEVNGSHCSCYGLEDQWSPEETSVKAILMRNWYSLSEEFIHTRVQAWEDFITTPEPDVVTVMKNNPLSDLFIVGLDGTVKSA